MSPTRPYGEMAGRATHLSAIRSSQTAHQAGGPASGLTCCVFYCRDRLAELEVAHHASRAIDSIHPLLALLAVRIIGLGLLVLPVRLASAQGLLDSLGSGGCRQPIGPLEQLQPGGAPPPAPSPALPLCPASVCPLTVAALLTSDGVLHGNLDLASANMAGHWFGRPARPPRHLRGGGTNCSNELTTQCSLRQVAAPHGASAAGC